MTILPPVRPGLHVNRLEEQVLVYDPTEDRVHLLDATTGCVLGVLHAARPTKAKALAELALRVDASSANALLALSIDELRRADLLADASRPPALGELTRRDLLRKVAVAGVSALLIPTITTLTAASAQAQGSCLPIGSPCTANTQCCDGSNGAPHCHHIGTDPPGSFCHDT